MAPSILAARPGLALAMCVSIASTATAAPSTRVSRTYREAREASFNRPTTHTLTRDGDRVTLTVQVEEQEGGLWGRRKDPAWKIRSVERYTGTLRTTSGGSRLDVNDGDKHLSYQCRPMNVLVASASARRVPVKLIETPSYRWEPRPTKRVGVLFCLPADDTEYGDALVFATPAIEHVMADDDCCLVPGESLRYVPEDRRVMPARQ
jgi:hypothetical protein